MNGLLIRDIRWKITTAGPSPLNNNRTELFLLGCKKAMDGNPCKGCFNSSTWDSSKAEFSHNPISMAKHINEHAPNKYITIGGGEPLDQIDNLIILCKELKKYGFNILVYTWRELLGFFNNKNNINNSLLLKYYNNKLINKDKICELIQFVDIIIDGEFIESEKIWNGVNNSSTSSFIGSGNQIVWNLEDKKHIYGYKCSNIEFLYLTSDNKLIYDLKNGSKELVSEYE